MDSLTNAAKRKKRKTRKCLDEMRKRSRRTIQILQDHKQGDMFSTNKPNNVITSNRLSIKMFPNAIQSKTVTRPEVLNVEHKQDLNLDELVSTNIRNALNTDVISIPYTQCSNTYDNFKNERHPLGAIDIDNIVIDDINVNNNESLELFNSMDEITSNRFDTQSVCTAASSSTQSLQDDYAYSLYEEFMSEVPPCIQQNSKLNQEDIMKENKMLLQNLFIESCYQECEDNILKCVKHDTPRTLYYNTNKVIQDPINYIRLNHIQQENQLDKLCDSTSSSGSTCHSPLRPSSLTSPVDARLNVITQDTPNYAYYPHKLN